MKTWAYPVLGLAVFLVAWEFVAWTWSSDGLIPHTPEIMSAILALCSEPGFRLDAWFTLWSTAKAFTVAMAFAIPVGVVLGSVLALHQAFGSLIDAARSTPAFVLLPLFLVVMGDMGWARFSMVFFGAAAVQLTYTSLAIRNVHALKLEVARVYRLPRRLMFRVFLMEALPPVLGGMRIALSLSLVLTLVAEIMGGSALGLGRRINDAMVAFAISDVYALIAVVGGMGFAVNRVAEFLADALTPWARQQ